MLEHGNKIFVDQITAGLSPPFSVNFTLPFVQGISLMRNGLLMRLIFIVAAARIADS